MKTKMLLRHLGAYVRQTKIHNIGATVVGVDKFGNKYYERLENTQFGRHRWVEYAQKDRYNASQVPPEWHGWLHYITDHTGDELLMLKPRRYGVEHKENFSGKVKSLSTIPRAMLSILAKETGPDTSHGNPQRPLEIICRQAPLVYNAASPEPLRPLNHLPAPVPLRPSATLPATAVSFWSNGGVTAVAASPTYGTRLLQILPGVLPSLTPRRPPVFPIVIASTSLQLPVTVVVLLVCISCQRAASLSFPLSQGFIVGLELFRCSYSVMHISGARDVCLPLLNLIRTRGFPILQQLHLEERLLRTSSSNWCIINDGTNQVNVVMGLSGRPAELIDIELLLQDRIPVIRRFTGGGTVVVDNKTIFVTFICNKDAIIGLQPYPRPIMSWSGHFYEKVFNGFGNFHLKENDYAFGTRKFGGNAQSITKSRWIHHTSFLWDYDDDNMKYLKIPHRAPRYRLARNHSDFLCRMKDYLTSRSTFIDETVASLDDHFDVKHVQLESVNEAKVTPYSYSTKLLEEDLQAYFSQHSSGQVTTELKG
ncbi:hypothetical protein HPP92_002574 [Vanilla planifolia]|uniref:BPL/LPL catalytic domain-containing protein n=1 Tax=Vanilla planifolia TaxID=51239 RepID=A0A835S5R1_VANPL|nr:hypothetical protein HPP92_002574 [Vanilla planifolia]